MIDESTGRPAIAYVGEAPWHKLGRALSPGADLATWTNEAGLSYTVERAEVYGRLADGGAMAYPERRMLYRSDTRAPLSVVSRSYQIVQPGDVLGFFSELAQRNSFTLETAGALDGGKRLWALARVHDGSVLLDSDLIRPYVLLATSYDASLSTTAKFTSVRVVCHNTLTMAAGDQAAETGEIRIPHSAKFDAKEARIDLGIVFDQWERFLATSRRLARQHVSAVFAAAYLKALLPTPPHRQKTVEETRAYKAIMALFEGGGIGADLPEAKGTAFGLLNAVTEYVDHQRGGNDTRLSSAWFGAGNGMKSAAANLMAQSVPG